MKAQNRKLKGSQKIIGVLGAGQLALFLNIKAQELGLKLLTLSNSKEDPVALKSRDWIQGDPNKKKDLKKFLSQVDILTFESEFFSADFIKECKNQTKVHPSLKNLADIQDRLSQKKLLARHSFPILDFQTWDNRVSNLKNRDSKKKGKMYEVKKNSSLQKTALLEIWNRWGPFVLKTRRGGYDGYGAFVVKNKATLFKLLNSSPAIPQALESSKKTSQAKNRMNIKKSLPKTSFIAEPLLSFKRELALISARNQKGQIVFFPLVESFQKNSVCLWVKGPVKHPKLTELKRKIKSFLTKIDYRGVIAFELFETESGLIINELAPRVHNTGHYSLSALTEDQFTLHLKAINNQELKTPQLLSKEFAMLNLLGEGSSQPLFHIKRKAQPLIEQTKILNQEGFHLYWYGKKESRPGRKMGHINCVGDGSLQKLLKLKRQLKV